MNAKEWNKLMTNPRHKMVASGKYKGLLRCRAAEHAAADRRDSKQHAKFRKHLTEPLMYFNLEG